MDNNKIISEAKRIANKLIDIKKSDEDLETIVNKLLSKKLKNVSMNVMLYIPNILAENKFYIESISPFELKEYNL